jgi:hypothetical protein
MFDTKADTDRSRAGMEPLAAVSSALESSIHTQEGYGASELAQLGYFVHVIHFLFGLQVNPRRRRRRSSGGGTRRNVVDPVDGPRTESALVPIAMPGMPHGGHGRLVDGS